MKTGLVSFLFSRSVGDQLAKVIDGLRQDKADLLACEACLSPMMQDI